jgi:hypothetical protein
MDPPDGIYGNHPPLCKILGYILIYGYPGFATAFIVGH